MSDLQIWQNWHSSIPAVLTMLQSRQLRKMVGLIIPTGYQIEKEQAP